jgi:hypothetical protein
MHNSQIAQQSDFIYVQPSAAQWLICMFRSFHSHPDCPTYSARRNGHLPDWQYIPERYQRRLHVPYWIRQG